MKRVAQGVRRLVPLLALGWFAACGAEPDEAPSAARGGDAVTIRDSAGIRIVENHDSAWTEASRWRLADEPTLVIGSLDGSAPGADFGRVDDAWMLGGRVVVVDGQSRNIRLFELSGEHVRSLGRRGDGPEEFGSIRTTTAMGDSVAVLDTQLGKLVVFPVNGGAARVTTHRDPVPDAAAGRDLIRHAVPGGGYLVQHVSESELVPAQLPISDRIVFHRVWRYVDTPGEPGDSLGRLGSFVMYNGGTINALDQPFLSPGELTVVRENSFWHAFPLDAFEFRRFELDGDPTGDLVVRRAWQAEPVPHGVLQGVRDYFYSTFPPDYFAEGAAARREMIEGIRVIDPLPAFTSLAVGSEGDVWVHDHPAAATVTAEMALGSEPVGSGRWSVFDPDGRWLGTVVAPKRLRITDVGPEGALGIRTDSLGVQTVEIWSVIKPQ